MTTARPGDRFRLTIIAREPHPLARGDARSAFVTLEQEFVRDLAARGVALVFRGSSIHDAPGGDLEPVVLVTGEPGWRRSSVFEVVAISPNADPELLASAPLGITSLVPAVPVLLLAAAAAAAGALAGFLLADRGLEAISSTAERVAEAGGELADELAEEAQLVAVVALAVVSLLILRT